jgi:hypothetical protein
MIKCGEIRDRLRSYDGHIIRAMLASTPCQLDEGATAIVGCSDDLELRMSAE